MRVIVPSDTLSFLIKGLSHHFLKFLADQEFHKLIVLQSSVAFIITVSWYAPFPYYIYIYIYFLSYLPLLSPLCLPLCFSDRFLPPILQCLLQYYPTLFFEVNKYIIKYFKFLLHMSCFLQHGFATGYRPLDIHGTDHFVKEGF